MTSLTGGELRRIEIDDDKVVSQELLLKMIGSIRDIQIGPDGYIYLTAERFNTLGSIVRLVPTL